MRKSVRIKNKISQIMMGASAAVLILFAESITEPGTEINLIIPLVSIITGIAGYRLWKW